MEIKNIDKILIIQLRRIGDVLLTTPIIEALREHFPSSKIDFLVEKPAYDVLTGNPYLSNIILSDKKLSEQIKLINRIRKQKYNLVFDFLGNPRSAWITFFSKAKYRVGFNFPGRKLAYNICVRKNDKIKYVVDFKLEALKSIGINATRKKMFFHIPDNAKFFADNLLHNYINKNRLRIGMAPASRRKARMWPKQYFAEIADRLIEKYNSQIILLWGPGEKQIVEKIACLMRNKPLIMPPTDIKQLAAFIEECNVLITNDNGPMHISVAVGTPTVTVYGPTNSDNWNPPNEQFHRAVKSNMECLACNKQECESMECMKKVTPEMVEKVIKEVLSGIGV